MSRRIGVLMGGSSSERDISLRSGKAVLGALQQAGMHAIGIDLTRHWERQIAEADLDIAFIALHGTLGEDGCIQGLLEIMGIPYTGSGVTASALCMNKRLCKQVLNACGLKTPVDIPIAEQGPVRYPVILKPICEGSSVGLHLVSDESGWQQLEIENVSQWMAEMPIRGTEIAVSVLHGEALPPVEVRPVSGMYDFEAKYTAGATTYHCPPDLPPETIKHCMQIAEKAVMATGCKGAPRVDMIVADGGEPVILEINTIPGMTETSLLPKAAEKAGIDFVSLCRHILDAAALEHAGDTWRNPV